MFLIFGLAWLGLAWLGLAWLGLAWLGWVKNYYHIFIIYNNIKNIKLIIFI
ncbi:hypothetical protein [Brachyspira hyodysenteriae]|uniref:hypothetical protein n=1 Tax=Brachyspira hyodysenteriae TaxID=159 RepID=UPI00164321AF|nr:hypothetical protein [Brachyspira hyodysenteriae]